MKEFYSNIESVDLKKLGSSSNNINDLSRMLESITEFNNYKDSIEYYEVLTDGNQFWVSMDDLVKICKEVADEELVGFDFKVDVLFGKKHVSVTENFLKFIKEKTINPKYVPQLALLKTVEYEEDLGLTTDGRTAAMAYASRVNGDTDVVYEGKSR